MPRLYTSNELIASVRDRAGLPDNEVAGGDDATVLRHLNEEMLTRLIPGLIKVREEYFVVSQRTTLSSSVTRYRIPPRAIGQKLRHLMHVGTDGNRYACRRIYREDLDGLNDPSPANGYDFYIEGSWIVLVTDSPEGYLEISYYMRPGQLVLVTDTRKITAIDTDTKTITIASTAAGLWTNGDLLDVHSPSSGADLKDWDLTAETVSGTSITFSEEIDGSVFGSTALAIGDYVCAAGEAALPALPRELHPILAQAAVVRVHESLGDMEGAQMSKQTLAELLSSAAYMVDPRVEGTPRPIKRRGSAFWGGRRLGGWY